MFYFHFKSFHSSSSIYFPFQEAGNASLAILGAVHFSCSVEMTAMCLLWRTVSLPLKGLWHWPWHLFYNSCSLVALFFGKNRTQYPYSLINLHETNTKLLCCKCSIYSLSGESMSHDHTTLTPLHSNDIISLDRRQRITSLFYWLIFFFFLNRLAS